jgi:MtN3 and saliva related transmembrane protein
LTGSAILAATLTTASFVPQGWLTFKTRDVSGISLEMYIAFTAGIALLLVAGILGIRVWLGTLSAN